MKRTLGNFTLKHCLLIDLLYVITTTIATTITITLNYRLLLLKRKHLLLDCLLELLGESTHRMYCKNSIY